jgi:serine-type D-Ala-D-Ala carboxypeptidase (penicillin-binding protein 5/6)
MPIKQYRRGSHPYHSYRSRVAIPKRRRVSMRRIVPIFFFVGCLCILAFLCVRYSLPIPEVSVRRVNITPRIEQGPTLVEWGQAQEAFGSVDLGVVAEKPAQAPLPTASTAKLITVLTVLQKKPLKPGTQGPTLVMTQQDVDSFNHYVEIGGSTAKVEVGERITQYQMIQGVLLPSANNLADTLAIWAFGSLEAYQKAAQRYVESIGARETTIGTDASGFSPTTRSTASDLTKIGIAAASHPVVREVVAQDSVVLPVAGEKLNTNWLLGDSGVVGGKTGNTDEAKGVFVFMSQQKSGEQSFMLVGAVQGASTVQEAMTRSKEMIAAYAPKFTFATYLRKNQVVAEYKTAWGETVSAHAARDLRMVTWPSRPPRAVRLTLSPASPPLSQGAVAGAAIIGDERVPIVLSGQLHSPTTTWRILR